MASTIVRWLSTAGTVALLCACGGAAPAPSAPLTDVAPSPSPPPSARRGPVEVVELAWHGQNDAARRHMRAWRGGCFELSGLGAAGSGQSVQTKRKGCIDAGKAEKLFGRLDKLYKNAKLAADPGYWPYDEQGLTLVGFPAKGTLWIANDEATARAFSDAVQGLIAAAKAVLHQQDLHPAASQ